MREKLKFTTDYIAQEWKKKIEDDKRISGNKIAKKFREILDEIGFTEEQISWYKSVSDDNNDSQRKPGKFIFNEDCEINMEELFNIMKNKGDNITQIEKDRIIHLLQELLPYGRNTSEIKDCTNYMEHKEKNSKKNKQYDEEEQKTKEILGRALSYEHEIPNILEKYYLRKICDDNTNIICHYEKRIFVEISKNEISSDTVREELYKYQYDLMKIWNDKWTFVMESVKRIRIAERFDIGKDIFRTIKMTNEKIADFCIYGNTDNENLIKEYKNVLLIRYLCEYLKILFKQKEKVTDNYKIDKKEDGREACAGFVRNVVDNELSKVSYDDYKYIMKEAFAELESIPDKIINKKNEAWYFQILKNYYDKKCAVNEKDVNKRDDIKLLTDAREWIEDNCRSIIDKQIDDTSCF